MSKERITRFGYANLEGLTIVRPKKDAKASEFSPETMIWIEGWDAYYDDKSLGDNPYGVQEEEQKFKVWREGWAAGQEDQATSGDQ